MNVVVYARYSSDSQREESIEGQLRECREYADRNGMTVVGSYIDRALSAKTADRPEFQRMIKDSAKGLFEIVLVWKLDHFSRDRYDSAHYKHILKKNGVKVVSAKEHISEGPEGIILESMREGYAEFYSAELSEKIHRGRKENTLKGKNNGGGIPLGYALDKQTQKLVIDPETAPLVVEIFTRYADGETVRSMIEDFNVRGLTTRKGKAFSMSSFNALLKNRKYIGAHTVLRVAFSRCTSKERRLRTAEGQSGASFRPEKAVAAAFEAAWGALHCAGKIFSKNFFKI